MNKEIKVAKKTNSVWLFGMHRKIFWVFGSVVQATVLMASPCVSDGPGLDAADDTSRTITLDDITIVSTPKEVGSLRQQPSASSLLSASQLNAAQVTSLKGISALVPNLFIPDYGSRLTSAVYIRGIGSRINTPAVGMYVDNIPYVDKSAFNFNFYDIERIDVLRGPQGTLYGRNTMGGIIRIHTRNPFNYEGTDLSLSYATGDNHRTLSLTHYHRASDSFAFSAGGYYDGSDGFFTNATTGKKADKGSAAGGRIRALYKANDRLTFDLSTSYDYSDEGAYPYYHLISGTNSSTHSSSSTISNNRESSYRRSMLNSGLNIEYQASAFVMNAITGYQHLTDRMYLDQDFIAADIYTLEQRQRINTLSEEVTFKSRDNEGGWYQWLTGVNVMYQSLHTSGPVTFYEDGVSGVIEGNINRIFSTLQLQNPKMPTMGITLQDREFVVSSIMDTPVFDFALFHSSTFSWNRWKLTAGLRFEYERLNLDYYSNSDITFDFDIAMSPTMAFNYPDLKASPLFEGKMDDDYLQVLPKVSLMYQLSADNNIYANVSKGYRSGGYNIQMFSDLVQAQMRSQMMTSIDEAGKGVVQKMLGEDQYGRLTALGDVNSVVYKPEYSWNYELGAHLNFSQSSSPLTLDAALFLLDTRDQQISRFAPSGLGRMMVNTGKSRSYGAEMSALWRPLQQLVITANYGYTHATFTDYDDGSTVANAEGETVRNDYSGNYVPFVPQHTLGLDAAYTWTLPSDWAHSLTLGASYNGAGRIYWTESNLTIDGEKACQDFYSTIGARLLLTLGNASIQLWGRNLADEKYSTFYFESAGRCFEQHGKPMQVGIDVKFHF